MITAGDKWILENIVGRCHVGESDLSVIRYTLSRMKRGTFRSQDRETRREILRTIIRVHRENRSLYVSVMRGA